MKIFEESFIIFINKNYFIQWVSENLAYYLGYQKEDLIGKDVSKIVAGKVKDILEVPKLFGALKDSENQLYTGIFTTTKVYDKQGNHIGYFLQFSFKEKDENLLNEFFIFNTSNVKMKKLLEKAVVIARSDVPVLIEGEVGTGKNLLAKWIHQNSDRRDFPFILVNCSSINQNFVDLELFGYEKGSFVGAITTKQGKIELANKGTLFLNEVDGLPSTSQTKFLSFMDSGEIERFGSNKGKRINVRIISATTKNLVNEIKENKFRLDLYYKLSVAKLRIPPLRERKEDIPFIVNSYLHKKGKKIKPKAVKFLMEHEWYGNIRELLSVLESATILAYNTEFIDIEHLTDQFINVNKNSLNEEKEVLETRLSEDKIFNEKERIKMALFKTNGNRKKAAELLGISVPTLWRKMKKYKLLEEFKR